MTRRTLPEEMQNRADIHQHQHFVAKEPLKGDDHVAQRRFRLLGRQMSFGLPQASLDLLLLDSFANGRSWELPREHGDSHREDEENRGEDDPA